jgi:putative cell wall-binding protein
MKGIFQLKRPKFSWPILLAFGIFFAVAGVLVVYGLLAADYSSTTSGDIISVSGKSIQRIYGPNRYATSAGASRGMYPDPTVVINVVLVSGENWPDAVVAAPLAGSLGAPLLLTAKDSLSSETLAEIVRLNPKNVYIIGSTGAISTTVETAIRNARPAAVISRVAGTDRYQTSFAVANKIKSITGVIPDGTAFFVTGNNYPDALSVGSVAAYKKYPVILVGTTLPSTHLQTINNLGIRRSIVVGGANVVPDAVKNVLPGPLRISGANRYETSINFVEWSRVNIPGMSFSHLGIATGENFPDALVAGVYMATRKNISTPAPGFTILSPYNISPAVSNYISSKKSYISHVYVFGGSNVVSDSTHCTLSGFVGITSPSCAQVSRVQALVNQSIDLCPILAGTTAVFGDAKGYQAITYYTSGRIIVSPTHTATLERIIGHEVLHVYDWRDNGRIDWGESFPTWVKTKCVNY